MSNSNSVPTPEQFPLASETWSEESVQRVIATVRRTLQAAKGPYPVVIYSGRGQPGDGLAWEEAARRLRGAGWEVDEYENKLSLSPSVVGG